MFYTFRAVSPLIIRSSKLYTQHLICVRLARLFLSYFTLTCIDSPYFIWQISFVIFRCYFVARVGGGMSGVRQYYKRAERKWRTIFVGLNKGNISDKMVFRENAPNSFSSQRFSLHWQTHHTFLFGNTGPVTARKINAATINVGVHTQCTASSKSSIRGVSYSTYDLE
jgi:hypothetical protein